MVRRGDRWVYVDPQGVEIAPVEFEACDSFSAGLAWVRRGQEIQRIDRDGRVCASVKVDEFTALPADVPTDEKSAGRRCSH